MDHPLFRRIHLFSKLGFAKAALWGYLLAILIAFQLGFVHAQKVTKRFKCPQQFGYYQDTNDCNKYFICVFGDALHDKCTPGLYFNNELRMCDWPRNVKSCDSGSKSSDTTSEGRRRFGTSTPRPKTPAPSRSSRNNQAREEETNINSIAPLKSTQEPRTTRPRYLPPISSASYIAAARNATHIHFRPVSSLMVKISTSISTSTTPTTTTTTPNPAPASFKPVYYRVTPKPLPKEPLEEASLPRAAIVSNKRKDYEDPEYYDDEYEDEDDQPHLILSQNLRGNNNIYVTPSQPKTSQRPRLTTSDDRNRFSAYPTLVTYYARPNNLMNPRPMAMANVTTPSNSRNRPAVLTSFHLRGQEVSGNSAQNSVSSESSESEEDKPMIFSYNRNVNNNRPQVVTDKPLPRGPPYSQQRDSLVQRVSPNAAVSSVFTNVPREADYNVRPQVNRVVSPVQSLNNGGDSLDAQFGTNPRSISLPDAPYRQNSFISNSEEKKAERNQQNVRKPQATPTKYNRPSYQSGSSNVFDDYPEYYDEYEDEYYDDEDNEPPAKAGPKVVIRLQKPSTTSTTRRPTIATTTRVTTRRTPTARPATRPLPFGISRPATKRPIRFGPRPLPKLPSRPPPMYSTPRALALAEKCSPSKCALPDCRCGSTDIPGGISAQQVPQIVLITFDDAVNDLNYELYAEIFDNRKNPNGCPILGTFYVSHEWTDYGMVQSLYSKGHEMASHSVTHSHGEKFTVNSWKKEIDGQREVLHLYGGVKLEDIRGMRAPFLQVGGNNMFEMLYDSNFTYDSSMPVLDNNPPFYPYTLDYGLSHECMIPPCPTKSFPGLWEVGMVMWNDYRGGRCSMGDACANPDNAEDVYKMLLKNFNRHYNSNRAPFGLFYHAAWFTTQHFRRGYMKFIEHINSKNDVYMVTNWQAIQWMREPTPLSHIKSFKPWQCPKDPEKPGPCHHPTSCSISYKGGNRNMRTCQPCPNTYPWTGRTGFDEVYG